MPKSAVKYTGRVALRIVKKEFKFMRGTLNSNGILQFKNKFWIKQEQNSTIRNKLSSNSFNR